MIEQISFQYIKHNNIVILNFLCIDFSRKINKKIYMYF